MKQKFVIEIDSSDYVSPVSENDLNAMLRFGMIEWRMSNLVINSVNEIPSQTVENERPSVVLKGLDWSNRNESEGLDIGDYLDDRLDEVCNNK